MNIVATPKGEQTLKDIEEWRNLRMIELSIIGIVVLKKGKSCDSVTLFKKVKEVRENPFLSDIVIARVVERLVYRGLLQVK